MRLLRLILALGVAALPSFLKIPVYRWCFGYQIGRGVRIGFSPFLGVRRCRLGDHTRIGHLNFFTQVQELDIGDHVRIGFLNVIRGGDRVSIGPYCTLLRQNTCNAILEAEGVKPQHPVLELGPGVFVASGHWLDFTDGISIGGHSIIGGRLSSLWTHNRQRSKAIRIGCHTYIGSEARVAPGAEIPAFCVVALGSVLIGRIERERVLIGGNPAAVVRDLGAEDFFLIAQKTRTDIPDELARALLPEDIQNAFLAHRNGPLLRHGANPVEV